MEQFGGRQAHCWSGDPDRRRDLGNLLTRLAKRFENLQWQNQRLIEKRIAVYDELASDLNDLLRYFTFVGCWKELKPPEVVALKRRIDKKVYLAAPLFSQEFFANCMNFLNLCYATFQGWGIDARLRTPIQRRKQAAGQDWHADWDRYFAEDSSDPRQIRSAYQAIMRSFSAEIGISPVGFDQPVGHYPANIC